MNFLLLNKIKAHLDNIALAHSIFALPFAYMGAFLACKGIPPLKTLIFITLVMVSARSIALILDNLIDLRYDKQQKRLAHRPLVRGIIKPIELYVLIAFFFSVFFYSVVHLPRLCLYLSPLALAILWLYPYTKRFTFLCHYVLGIALAMAPIGGYMAVTGRISFPSLVLGTGVCFWIGTFD